MSLDPADTGIVRLEASLHRAPQLRQMPVHLDLEWREAQLGQLSRLIIGSDPGWRGDLTGELHLDGTAEAAQVKTRLRATGVHRAEFAPAEPLDFDANCGFVYHYSRRAIDNLVCDSPLGDGHIRLAGDLPGNGRPKLSVELQRIPVQAGLDILRTLRSGLDAGLEAKGTVSGKLTYDPSHSGNDAQDTAPPHGHSARIQPAKAHPVAQEPLSGSLAVEGFGLSGDGLSQPIQIAKITLEPVPVPEGQAQALATAASIPAGGTGPLAVTARLALAGYRVTVRGPASLARIRQLAHVANISDTSALDAIAGDPATLDLSAEGPWLSAPEAPFSRNAPAGPEPVPAAPTALGDAASDQLSGSVILRNVNWKAGFLANHVQIFQATLHMGGDVLLWDPVVFSYGPLKGTASLQVPLTCEADEPCPPQLEVHFAELDADALQAALLGAHEPGTLLSTLIARFSPSSAPVWPRLDAKVKADSLILGPVKFENAEATLRMLPTGAEITALDAGLLGGQINANGTLSNGNKPTYALEGTFNKLSTPAVCQLLGLRCTGGTFDGNGKVDLSGFTGKDLAASAKGAFHFEWRHGAIRGHAVLSAASVPPVLARFDLWTADAVIANGALTLQQNQARYGARKSAVEASVEFGGPPRVTFAVPGKAASAKR